MRELEKIIDYNMTLSEAKAFKLALMWCSLTKKNLPEEHWRLYQLPKGDPRKSHLFKICWKLLRETRGLIKDGDYKLYLLAQIQVLKSIANQEKHAKIDNNVIIGVKAWKRWQLWLKNYNKTISES